MGKLVELTYCFPNTVIFYRLQKMERGVLCEVKTVTCAAKLIVVVDKVLHPMVP